VCGTGSTGTDASGSVTVTVPEQQRWWRELHDASWRGAGRGSAAAADEGRGGWKHYSLITVISDSSSFGTYVVRC
jgi:hypothetical protein